MIKDKIVIVFLGILVAIAFGAVLSLAETVVLPMVIAILTSFMLYPLVIALEKIKIPRIIGIILVLVFLSGFCYLVAVVIYSSLNTFVVQFPWYIEQFKDIYKDFSGKIMQKFNIENTDFLLDHDWATLVRSYFVRLSNSVGQLAGYIFIIFLILIFLFLEFPMFKTKLNKAFPRRTAKSIVIIIGNITRDVGKYLLIKVFISSITGFLVWFVLLLVGLDFALIWGFLAFFLNFIPNIGSTIIVILISMQAVVQFYPSTGMVILVASTMTAIQVTMGSILEPRMQGAKLNLSPVLILFCLFFWGWLWGSAGAILSVPITVTIKIVFSNIEFLRPVSIMMGTGVPQKKHNSIIKYLRDFFCKKK